MTESPRVDGEPGGPSLATAVAEPLDETRTPPVTGRGWQRLLGRRRGVTAGPTLLCVAGLHGNEPAGVLGVERVLARLSSERREFRGEFVGLAGNVAALAAGRRFVDEDLNRMWLDARLERGRRPESALSAEEAELRQLAAEIDRIVAAARGPVYLLDLHTFSAPGPAFVVLDDTLLNREFGEAFPVPMVFGLEEELAGTLSHHLTARGAIPVGFEAGQHGDPEAEVRAAAAVWIALEASGVLAADSHAEPEAARRRLRHESRALPRVVEVRYRHPVAPHDGFTIRPDLRGFQPVRRGEILAQDRSGPVRAPQGGLLLMPLFQPQGEDGFFVVRPVRPVWLSLSRWLRRRRFERLLTWLPGVRRHPELEETLVVDRRVARWLALQLFHLLGYRRRGIAGRYLVMARRRQ